MLYCESAVCWSHRNKQKNLWRYPLMRDVTYGNPTLLAPAYVLSRSFYLYVYDLCKFTCVTLSQVQQIVDFNLAKCNNYLLHLCILSLPNLKSLPCVKSLPSVRSFSSVLSPSSVLTLSHKI